MGNLSTGVVPFGHVREKNTPVCGLVAPSGLLYRTDHTENLINPINLKRFKKIVLELQMGVVEVAVFVVLFGVEVFLALMGA